MALTPFRQKVAVLLAPFAGGQAKPGVDHSPAALIQAGLLDALGDATGSYTISPQTDISNKIKALTLDWDEYRDSSGSGMRNPGLVSQVTQLIAEQAYLSASEENTTVLTIGGDCSIKLGTLAGTAKAMRDQHDAELGVIYIDAHADINTPRASPSGNMHGMPLAFLTGVTDYEESKLLDWITPRHRISKHKLVLIAVRDVDDAEQLILDKHHIKVFGTDQIRSQGIEAVVDQALVYLGADTPIHLSWDVDALDPEYAPSTGFPTPGGLSLEEGKYIARKVGETGRVVAVDFSEINPEIGNDEDVKTTLVSAIEVIKSVFDAGSAISTLALTGTPVPEH